jgi:hypothetical protein
MIRMTDDSTMRFRLQQVLAYRHLQAAVRSGASHTLVNAAIWIALTFMLFQAMGLNPVLLAYLGLGVAELLVGLWKKMWPTLEAVLADGLVLAGFGLFILLRQLLAWQGIIFFPVSPISLLLGCWWLVSAFNSFRAYGALRRAFPERPSAEVIAWFDELIYEIRHADPATDDLALDLPTKPHWKAKLLGTTAFFVAKGSNDVLIAGPWDFELAPDEHPDRPHRVRLHILDRSFKPFEIDEASRANYQKWMAQHQSHQS